MFAKEATSRICSDLQKAASFLQDTFTEKDFTDQRSYAKSFLSDAKFEEVKAKLVGTEVDEPEFSLAELEGAGYSSWKQYEVCAFIRQW